MHEGHFTEQIVESILQELAKYPKAKVRSVTVRVGEVFHLVPESVLMHYDVMTKDSPLQGVKLDLIQETLQVVCGQCNKQGPVEDHHLLLCSFCHSRQVKPVLGDKITIEKVELEKL
ncbi:MAG: hydrogenase maturation nickel metallochaperone HypA [Candidatus Omnitrophica bacterium]|nr:hydrogenase maturation nickel metallochaperone HypA [Candidatus Omnitrophota bacterium]